MTSPGLNAGFSYRETAGAAAHGRSALDYLSARHTHSSRDRWHDRLVRGEVEIAGRTAAPETILIAGAPVVWHRPPWHEPDVPRHFTVVHQDAAIVVVAKPAGLPTLPAGGFLDNTLLALVQARYPDADAVHRLGRFTSGLVLFARTTTARTVLSRDLRERRIEKNYRASVAGAPDWEQRTIRAPIGPVPHPRLGSVHAAAAAGREAVSHVKVVRRGESETLVEVSIETGRPHQIRIHLAWAGHPLVGDPLYAIGGVPRADDPGLPGDGGYLLHATRLRFGHPQTGSVMELHSLPPPALR